MRVLAWQSYGDTKVYAADTAEQCRFIAAEVTDIIKGWCCDEFKEDLDRFAFHMANPDMTTADIRRHIRILVCDVCDDTDDFEYFDFSEMVVK